MIYMWALKTAFVDSEKIIMRKEIARLHEKIDGLSNTISEYKQTIAENERIIADLKMENSTDSRAICQNCGT